MDAIKSANSIDEDLIILAKQGDKDAFSKLISNIYANLYSIARLHLDNEDDIQDVLQETCLNAYLCLSKLKDNSFFKTWITKILLNEINKTYKIKNHNKELFSKYASNLDTPPNDIDVKLDLEAMKKFLTDNENKLVNLYYKEGYSIKEISKKLNINENTVKTRLRSARRKVRNNYLYVFLALIFVMFVSTTAIFGQDIISFIKNIFDLSSTGYNNDNILAAIENKDWVQNVDMDYISINENYSIKVSYLLIDDINLYLVFDFYSNIDLDKHNRLSITDLKIETDDGSLIADEGEFLNIGYSLLTGWKNVEATSNSIRELVFFVSDGYPQMNSLKISFNTVVLYTSSHDINAYTITLPEEISFTIDIDDKFIDKSSISYTITNTNDVTSFSIEKAIYSDTGFYAIVKCKDDLDFIIEDSNNTQYKASKRILNLFDSEDNFYFLISANISSEDKDHIIIKNKKVKSQAIELTLDN